MSAKAKKKVKVNDAKKDTWKPRRYSSAPFVNAVLNVAAELHGLREDVRDLRSTLANAAERIAYTLVSAEGDSIGDSMQSLSERGHG